MLLFCFRAGVNDLGQEWERTLYGPLASSGVAALAFPELRGWGR